MIVLFMILGGVIGFFVGGGGIGAIAGVGVGLVIGVIAKAMTSFF